MLACLIYEWHVNVEVMILLRPWLILNLGFGIIAQSEVLLSLDYCGILMVRGGLSLSASWTHCKFIGC